MRASVPRPCNCTGYWPIGRSVPTSPGVDPLLAWEETERARRSLERRLRCAHIGRFKPLADFDWAWPQQCDQRAIAELMTLDFLASSSNTILVGSSGLGKTMIAQNIAYQAILQGHTVASRRARVNHHATSFEAVQILHKLPNRRVQRTLWPPWRPARCF